MGLYEEVDEKRTGPILYSFTKLLAVNFRGRYKILIKKGPWDADCQRWSPVGDLGGILLRKISKIEVLRNGIFGILRPSECVIIILNLGVLIKPLEPCWIHPRLQLSIFNTTEFSKLIPKEYREFSWEKLENMLSFEIKEIQFHLCTGNRTTQKN